MGLIAAIVAVAALVWGAALAPRVPLVVGAAGFVIVGYVFGFDFWNAHVGPLPLTLDRLVLLALAAAFAIQWRQRRLSPRPLTHCDWLLGGIIIYLAASALAAGPPAVAGAASPWGRLATAFVIPAVLYAIVRQAPFSQRGWLGVLVCFVGLGVYLAVTALSEVTGQWSLVFPHFIADPNLGIHFGRAHGPDLNAASLGIYLTACGCCAWFLLREVGPHYQKLALALVLPLVLIAVYATYTRSTWFGLAAAVLVIAAFETPRHWRLPALAGTGLVGLFVIAVSWNHLVGLKREGTAAESEHSVDQRESFTYVSWQMFKDHPLLGVGFGRFYDRKLPYLSDRSQPFELESIRPLHHHNTFLGFLTETGLFGLAAYVALLTAWGRHACRLATLGASADRRSVRAIGVLMLALLANYVCSAVFHDLTLVPTQHWLLFVFAAMTVNMEQQSCGRAVKRETRRKSFAANSPNAIAPSKWSGLGDVVKLFGMSVSRVTMPEAVQQVLEWCRAPRGTTCRYVVTPNLNHAVMFQHRGDLRAAYADASLTVADGAPLVIVSRWLSAFRSKLSLPERVAGSDLVPKLLAANDPSRPLRVFLLGAAPGVAKAAARRIQAERQGVHVVATYSPPPGFEHDPLENSIILKAIAATEPDLLVIGLGAPKQEVWVHRQRRELRAKVAICAGATIDFLAGEKRRAPKWMRRAGLEWAHRISTEPRRLTGRYLRDACRLPQLVWREMASPR